MAPTTSRPWPPPSTADRARRSVGERLPRLSTPCCDPVRLVLRRPRESVQYAAEPYRKVLRRHGIRQSMSRKGNCYDNAPMESFFGSLKTGLLHRTAFPTRQARQARDLRVRGGLLQPPAPTLRPRLLDPGPGLRADGQGRVTHLTHPSTPAGQAHHVGRRLPAWRHDLLDPVDRVGVEADP